MLGHQSGDAVDAPALAADADEREAWFEGWRIHDVLQQDPPTEEDILENLARGDRH
jgi:hypothetical protein